MAVRIRLRRQGSKNNPYYRIVVADARHPNQGRFIESIGWYDPNRDGRNFDIESDRVDYWVSKGAQVSDTVNSFIKRKRKNPDVKPAAAGDKPAAPAAKAAPAPAEEAPAEEAAAEAASAEEASAAAEESKDS